MVDLGSSDFLAAAELTGIKDDIAALLDDAQVTVAITYRTIVTSFDPTTGLETQTATDISARGILGEYNIQELSLSGGLLQQGDIFIFVDQADVPTTPTVNDRVIIDSVTYEVVHWETDPLQAFWRIGLRVS